MTNRLLEIGASHNTAIANPGDILQHEDVEYYAVDSTGVNTVVTWNKMASWDADIWPHELHKKGCIGTMDKLPFKPSVFGRIIMKNVIGEYSLGLQRDANPQRVGMMSGQSYVDTMQGFLDVHRVLEPHGTLVISEEDTPANCLQLASHLSEIGFNDITITPYNASGFEAGFGEYREHVSMGFRYGTHPRYARANEGWLSLRGAYWSVTNKVDQWGNVPLGSEALDTAEDYWRHAYVMTASKPGEINPI